MKKIIISFVAFTYFFVFSWVFAQTSSELSQSDKKLYEKIQNVLGSDFENKVSEALAKYEEKRDASSLTPAMKAQSQEKIIIRIDGMIEELIGSYTEGAVPSIVQQKYFALSYIKFELMMLDMWDDSLSLNTELKKRLTPLQYDVTQNAATEKPFDNAYFDNFEEGIYVDIINGEVLFSSTDKFKTNTGWPAFAKPISQDAVDELEDLRFNMTRIEVTSASSASHLWHIFNDGPKELWGLRYCINSASLKFIAKQDLEAEGYGEYVKLFNS